MKKILLSVFLWCLVSFTPLVYGQDVKTTYAEELRGFYKHDSSDCESFYFLDGKTVIEQTEPSCRQDTLTLLWMNESSFYFGAKDGTHPTMYWIYKIDNFDGPRLNLTRTWVGWAYFDPVKLAYRRIP